MTEIEQAALRWIGSGPRTCSELGSLLWGRMSRTPQSYARPAGRLLYRLLRRGLVVRYYREPHFVWALARRKEAKS